MARDSSVYIMCGIPASGKTTFAKALKETFPLACLHDLDKNLEKRSKMYGRPDPEDSIEKALGYDFSYDRYYIIPHIVDGLLFTNEMYLRVIRWIIQNTPKSYKPKFYLHYWIPDVEICKHNDKYRREVTSSNSIDLLAPKFEVPDVTWLIEQVGGNISIEVEEHMVEPKSEMQMFFHKFGISESISSSTWSLGGEERDCWGNKWARDTEAPESNFEDFDELIEKICPSITFMQYKKIYRACVTIEEEGFQDYYSSGTNAYYKCDCVKLYEVLKELNLIN